MSWKKLVGGDVDGEKVGAEVGLEGVEVVLGLSFDEGKGELGVEAVLEMVAGGASFAGWRVLGPPMPVRSALRSLPARLGLVRHLRAGFLGEFRF